MKKLIKSIVTVMLAGCLAASMASGVFAADNLTLGTGGTTGTYYAIGGVMATVLNPILEESQLVVTSTGASKANIQEIEDGGADLATVQNDVMYYAYTGTDLFSSEGAYDSFRAIAGLYDETVQIITCNPDIKTVADLAGKSVSVGDAGSGVEFNAKQILKGYGLTFDDIKKGNFSFKESAEGLQNGTLDACFITAGAPNSALQELAFTAGLELVPVGGAEAEAICNKHPFYTKTTIPAGTYKGTDVDTEALAIRATLAVSKSLDDETVYEMTKALFENLEKLGAAHAKGKEVGAKSAVTGVSVPFHPGAAKYFREIGVLD